MRRVAIIFSAAVLVGTTACSQFAKAKQDGDAPGERSDLANKTPAVAAPEAEEMVYLGDEISEEWSGTFDTTYGELRLAQIGRRIYGDYVDRGYFEGCAHDDGLTMRATFQYITPRSKHGFVEFRTDGDGFEGTWTWTHAGPPPADATVNWRGARKAAVAPSLINVKAEGMNFSERWPDLGAEERRWVLGSEYYDSCDPPEVEEDY